jgi:hypothetical protein
MVGEINSIRIPANENLERNVAEMVPITISSALLAVPEAPRTALRPQFHHHPRQVYSVAHVESVRKINPFEFSGIRFVLPCQPPRFHKNHFTSRQCARVWRADAFARPKSKQ